VRILILQSVSSSGDNTVQSILIQLVCKNWVEQN